MIPVTITTATHATTTLQLIFIVVVELCEGINKSEFAVFEEW